MSVLKLLDGYKQRLSQISEAIHKSMENYTKSENELKQHLANHNALIGAQTEDQNIVNTLTSTLDAVAPDSTADKIAHGISEALDADDPVEPEFIPEAVPIE